MLRTLWILPLLALLLIAGCDDDPTTVESGASISGKVTDLAGNPVTDAALLLVDAATLAPVGAPVVPNDQGSYAFRYLEPGAYSLLLYHDSRVIFSGSNGRIEVERNASLTRNLRLVSSGLWGSSRYAIAGTVRDAVTLEPIAGAYVSDIVAGVRGLEVFAEVGGISQPEWDATDAGGGFEIGTQIVVDEDNNEIGMMPVSIAAEGYLPTTLVGDGVAGVEFQEHPRSFALLPVPAEGDSVLQVSVVLTPASQALPAELGSVSGRLVYLGDPAPGVRVAATVLAVSDPDTVPAPTQKAILPGTVTTTDADGNFTLNGLAPGLYSVAAGYPIDDEWEGVNGSLSDGVFEITANTTTAAGDLELLRNVPIVSPAHGSTVPGSMPLLQWEAIPGAIYYDIYLGIDGYILDELVPRTEVTSYQMLPAEAIFSGSCARWGIRAYGTYPTEADTVQIGESTWTSTFCVD